MTQVRVQGVFRDAMAEFPTGVAVITATDHEGRPVGATVSSMTALSLEPPLVIVCLAHASETRQALRLGDAFLIHVLRAGQESVARSLALKGAEKFDDVSWSSTSSGLPVIAGCAVTVECLVENLVPGGDHMIIVGAVRNAEVHGGSPLLYHRRSFTRIPE